MIVWGGFAVIATCGLIEEDGLDINIDIATDIIEEMIIIISTDQKQLLEAVLLGRGEGGRPIGQDKRRELVVVILWGDCGLGGDDFCRAAQNK